MKEDPINDLLTQWEGIYKKGLLTFWMLLLLGQREVYAYEMRQAIEELSQGTITADDNSLYRALRRFADNGLVMSDVQPSEIGPPRRYFRLTESGKTLLSAFIQRNILIFQTTDVRTAIENICIDPNGVQ
jgi:DNA-binding PadR family transcriptional regulator